MAGILDFSVSDQLVVLLPLADTKDGRQKRVVDESLQLVKSTLSDDERRKAISQVFRRTHLPVPQDNSIIVGVIWRMIRRNPRDGLSEVCLQLPLDDPARKEIVRRQHAVSVNIWKQRHGFVGPGEVETEAREALETLSKHGEWWVRLYVAETLRQFPQFQTLELRERLKQDTAPLVREAAAPIF